MNIKKHIWKKINFIIGTTCNVRLENPCIANPCQNGKCVLGSEPDEFKCICDTGYLGHLCDSRLDGAYKNLELLC